MSGKTEGYRLKVRKLNIGFKSAGNCFNVVNGVDFDVMPGEIVSLVGESGCGKSASCLAVGRLLNSNAVCSAEEITFNSSREGRIDLLNIPDRKLRKVRGRGIAYIFQEPSASLNPVFRIGDQIAEVIYLHDPGVSNVRGRVIELLEQVGIPAPESRIDSYPHEMSGGMQQRVMIAMALAGNPEVLIADEPTTALDVTIQSQILELIDRLRRERNMSVILVTHNLGIVSMLADRVVVMYAGMVVESGDTRQILSSPCHPYTGALLKAVPVTGRKQERLQTVPGSVSSPENFPAGCRFCDRCTLCASLDNSSQKLCREQVPECSQNASRKLFCHFRSLS